MSDSSRRYWLVKTEPECFSIQHLAASPLKTAAAGRAERYQSLQLPGGDAAGRTGADPSFGALRPPAVVSTAVVVGEAYADLTRAKHPLNEHF